MLIARRLIISSGKKRGEKRGDEAGDDEGPSLQPQTHVFGASIYIIHVSRTYEVKTRCNLLQIHCIEVDSHVSEIH